MKNLTAYVGTSALSLFLIMIFLVSCENDESSYNPSAPITVANFIPLQGGVGTEILITGNNFSTDTSQMSVTLNGKAMRIIGANGNQLMVAVPSKAGSGPLVIKIDENSVESTVDFTYVFSRIVTTLAGSGEAGFLDAQGKDAMFNFNGEAWYRSSGITVDDNLNVYVADPGNHCIRKIDSLGNVTTLAGDPNTAGYSDGQGIAAKFNSPYAVAVDNEGNVYSADPLNWDIRKISPDGVATTLAWGHQAPWSIDVDKTNGTVYYTSNSVPGNVYQVSPDGTTTEIISGINLPGDLALDMTGNIFVSVNGDHVIKKYVADTWEGSIIAGQEGVVGYENGVGTEARFSYPWGIATDVYGNIYVAGNGSWDGSTSNADQAIRYIKGSTWEVSTFAGSNTAGYTDAVGEAASFSAPGGVAVDKYGAVYVLDKNNNSIRKIISE